MRTETTYPKTKETIAFLYRWTHLPTGKWYVGSRTANGCHPADGYICSSKVVKPMILENSSEWSREVLVIGNSSQIIELEHKYLVALDAKNSPMSFNMHNGDGKFTQTGVPRSTKTKAILKQKCSGWSHTEQTKQAMSENRHGEDNPFFGKKHSDDVLATLKQKCSGWSHTAEAISKIIASQTGVLRTEQAKRAISAGVKNLAKVTCEYCDKECSPALHGRWHGDNCKHKELTK